MISSKFFENYIFVETFRMFFSKIFEKKLFDQKSYWTTLHYCSAIDWDNNTYTSKFCLKPRYKNIAFAPMVFSIGRIFWLMPLQDNDRPSTFWGYIHSGWERFRKKWCAPTIALTGKTPESQISFLYNMIEKLQIVSWKIFVKMGANPNNITTLGS